VVEKEETLVAADAFVVLTEDMVEDEARITLAWPMQK
jgi:hypothetical protein